MILKCNQVYICTVTPIQSFIINVKNLLFVSLSVLLAASTGSSVCWRRSAGAPGGHREWATGISGGFSVRWAAGTSREIEGGHDGPTVGGSNEGRKGKDSSLLQG